MHNSEIQYNHRLVWQKGIIFICLVLFTASISAKSLNSSTSEDNDIYKPPQYSILYDQLLKLEQEGKYIKALRMIPGIYASEDISIDTFYLTLDKKREQLLDIIIEENIPFRIGKENFTCSGIMKLFINRYISKADTYNFLVSISSDLEYNSFCYLLIIEGYKQTSSDHTLLIPSSSQFNLQSALDSADPSLVSAALFFARKQKISTISAQSVIDRWEKRPDLWHDKCTEQALLFFAHLSLEAYKKLYVSNANVKSKLAKLQPIPNNKSYILPFLFSSDKKEILYINSLGITLYKQDYAEDKGETIKHWSLAGLHEERQEDGTVQRWINDIGTNSTSKQIMKNGVIDVTLGVYKIQFDSRLPSDIHSGFLGKSGVVEVKQGELVVIPVPLIPAI